MVEKHGFDVSIEAFKRFFRSKFDRNVEIKAERAPYYKLLPHLEEVIVKVLGSDEENRNCNSYVLFFDDLDIGFSNDDKASTNSLISLVRACRHVNNEVFAKNHLRAKAVILLRDDIEAYLSFGFADTAKIFSSYSSKINWYQDEYVSSPQKENELNLKKFINRRIEYAFDKAGISYNKADPWGSLVNQNEFDKSSFKHIVNQTLFRPRDLLLFFKPLESGVFKYPLSRYDISSLIKSYSGSVPLRVGN